MDLMLGLPCEQALKQSAEFLANKIEALSELTATPTSQLKLVADAWAQACLSH